MYIKDRLSKLMTFHFLRATAEYFARLSHGLGVRPSVCHTAVKCQDDAS